MTENVRPGYESFNYDKSERLIYPKPVPAGLRDMHPAILASDWPVRVATRRSTTSALDLLCRWHSLRGLAFVNALSLSTISAEMRRDMDVHPGVTATTGSDFRERLDRLEREARNIPDELLEDIARSCTPLLANSPHSAFIVATGLTKDSLPSTNDAIFRSAALSGSWEGAPVLRPGLALAWAVNEFTRKWVSWAEPGNLNDRSNSLGIGSHPAADRPQLEDAPEWLTSLLSLKG
ncbi:hypothetical protein AB0I10_08800 [Streptomyces sp. NPDC050636]|uniref:hypothetical protein n=1 Tax=Streptomyces sp. NPDC050636 TaxID=3154510 RepID=UPI003429A08B